MSRGSRVQRYIRIQHAFPRPVRAATAFDPGCPVATERFRGAGRCQRGLLAARYNGSPRSSPILLPRFAPGPRPTARSRAGCVSSSVRFAPSRGKCGSRRKLPSRGRKTIETDQIREDRRRLHQRQFRKNLGCRCHAGLHLRCSSGPVGHHYCRGPGSRHSGHTHPSNLAGRLGIGHRSTTEHRSRRDRDLGTSVSNTNPVGQRDVSDR